jgi:ABC-2 type transport system permease protein
MIRGNVILAVTKRNFRSYFSGILGYLFVIVFCVLCSSLAFDAGFFAANQANLDQLNERFPYLLLFLIPAITMTCWADEKKLGTDELLFTLPATDTEILLGKYLSVLGVYSVAVLFSLVNAMILGFLGDPDVSALLAGYFGYWVAGASLLSIGMLASALTSSATVAFVLGAVFCCVPVFIVRSIDLFEWLLQLLGVDWNLYQLRTALEAISLPHHLRDFTVGVIPFSGLCYFGFLTAFMLYLNMVVISKRRWHSSSKTGMEVQFAIRAVSLGITLLSVLVLVSLFPARADLTAERLFTLSAATHETLDSLGDGQKVTIQAFVSPDVPQDYSETRRRLLGLLREYDLSGGGSLEVRRVDVEPFSVQAEQARALGINPVRIQYEQDGKTEEAEVFLGAVVQGTAGNVVEIPFFGKGLPLEYELTRSIRTVSQDKRLTVGVLQTDAAVIGDSSGFGGGGRDWEIVRELKKQYNVVAVNPSRPILVAEDAAAADDEDSDLPKEGFDVLIAVMPSSLTQPQMGNFLEYVRSGKPVLIFDDIFPTFNPGLAPILPKPAPGGPMAGMMGQQPRPEPKADNGELTSLMDLLDVKWDNGQVVFDHSNPYSQLSYLQPEVIFISRAGNPTQAFSEDSRITSQLQDVVCLFSGTLQERNRKEDQEFIPLLQTSGQSGLMTWDEFTEQSFNPFSMSSAPRLRENPPRFDDKYAHVVAAHIKNDSEDSPLNVVFCSDVDMIGDQFFTLRNRQFIDIEFDNVTFVLNAVDVLAGEDLFIDLRSRRAELRTLEFVEQRTRALRKKLSEEEKEADKAMNDRLDEARKELQAEVDAVQERTDLDPRSKEQLLRQKEETLNRKLERDEKELENEKNARIRKVALDTRREVRRIESQIGTVAYVVPAILPVLFGLIFLGIRKSAEQNSITPERRRR